MNMTINADIGRYSSNISRIFEIYLSILFWLSLVFLGADDIFILPGMNLTREPNLSF